MLDSIFPPRPHEVLLRTYSHIRLKALFHKRTYEGITYLLPYHQPLVTALITENKFHHNEKAATLLAQVLADWLETQPSDALLVPIPLSKERRKSRGYNQIEEILKRLPKTWHQNITTTLLVRQRHTEAQTTLQREARLKNMQGAFRSNPTTANASRTIIVIDDVVTTGATLKAARRALQVSEPEAHIILVGLTH